MSTDLLGMDIHAANELAGVLAGWPAEAEEIIELVTRAEFLSDMPTGVVSLLDELGSDGSVMSHAIHRAARTLVGFHISIESPYAIATAVESVKSFVGPENDPVRDQRVRELRELVNLNTDRGDTDAARVTSYLLSMDQSIDVRFRDVSDIDLARGEVTRLNDLIASGGIGSDEIRIDLAVDALRQALSAHAKDSEQASTLLTAFVLDRQEHPTQTLLASVLTGHSIATVRAAHAGGLEYEVAKIEQLTHPLQGRSQPITRAAGTLPNRVSTEDQSEFRSLEELLYANPSVNRAGALALAARALRWQREEEFPEENWGDPDALPSSQFRPSTGADLDLSPFEPVGHGLVMDRREYWRERTRVNDELRELAELWATEYDITLDEAIFELASYRALTDKGVNNALLTRSSFEISGERAPRVIVETEARRLFIQIELQALANGSTEAIKAAAHDGALASLGSSLRSVGYPNSDENSLQVATAYSMLMAKSSAGILLPTLTTKELDLAVATGDDEAAFTMLNTEILSVTGAMANLSDSSLAVGLSLLATMGDGLELLIAISEGNRAVADDKVIDLVGGAIIIAAARWLLPRVVGGPIVAMASLLFALSPGPNDRQGGTPNPPRVGSTNEFGVRTSNGVLTAEAGFADTIAGDR